MTQASPVTRAVTFRARAGHGQALAERLLHAAALVAEAPGLPGVSENAAEVMRLVAEPPEVAEGNPLGGAGTIGRRHG